MKSKSWQCLNFDSDKSYRRQENGIGNDEDRSWHSCQVLENKRGFQPRGLRSQKAEINMCYRKHFFTIDDEILIWRQAIGRSKDQKKRLMEVRRNKTPWESRNKVFNHGCMRRTPDLFSGVEYGWRALPIQTTRLVFEILYFFGERCMEAKSTCS